MSAQAGTAALLAQGFILGWSVAWPPGPINAEMIRRGLTTGFRSAAAVGLGACSGDFFWALAVASGVGIVANIQPVRIGLAVISGLLLLLLAWVFLSGALRTARTHHAGHAVAATPALTTTRAGFVLGFTLALSSPWNIAFWLAVMGRQATGDLYFFSALFLAGAVMAGALTWIVVLCTALRVGARFATPTWDIVTRGLTGLLMLYFAGELIWKMTRT